MNGLIDVAKYRAEYEDLQEALGEDVPALWQHYQAFGAAEGRAARDEEVVAAEEAKKLQELSKPSESQKPSEDTENSNRENIYDAWGNPAGILEYDGAGNRVKDTMYNADGSIRN